MNMKYLECICLFILPGQITQANRSHPVASPLCESPGQVITTLAWMASYS